MYLYTENSFLLMPENSPGSVNASGFFIWEEETLIQIEHVSKTFSGKYGTVHALDDVSIHVEKGDIKLSFSQLFRNLYILALF